MRTRLFKSFLVLSLLILGIGNAWAGSKYYTAFSATTNDTGKGLVYTPSTVNTNTGPTDDSQYGATGGVGQSEDTGGSSKTNSYYAWAKPARGYAFDKWTLTSSNSNKGVAVDNANKASGAKITVTSNVTDDTNTGTATATWKNDPNTYTVTFGVPTNGGSYAVTYSYTTIEEGAFTTGGFSFSMNTNSSVSDGQKTSYKDDTVTVSTDAVNFDGWYNNSSFSGTALSTSNSYSFTVTGATSIYAKFKPATMYYGKVVAQIPDAPYSMPGGGTIFVSTISGYSDSDFSSETQNVVAATANMDATPPASVNQTYYLHAKPSDKRYVFRGWYTNPEGTGTALSTSQDYTYTFAVSSKDEANPTTQNIYACFDFNLYYMQVEVEPAVPGLGMVFVKDDNSTTPVYTEYTTHSEKFLYAYRRLAPTANAYLYAKPKYGYKFSGWYDNPDCTGTAKSIANPYTFAANGTSTDPMNPTIIHLYAKFEEDDSKVNITYNIPDKTKGEYTASVLDIAEVDDDFVWTFTKVYNSADYTANTTLSQNKTDVLKLEAQPNAGYGVTSWTIAGTAKTTPSHLYETTATAAATYGVTFGDAKPFLVSTNSTQYATLREALTAVGNSGQITVVQNAYVEEGDYTIPKDVTLLVPFDDAYTLRTTDPTHTYAAPGTPSVYCKLTLGSNVHITVKNGGAISVSSTSQGGQPYGGCVYGKYGQIDMLSGSTITLESGSNLYCWGYITGAGEITAQSGSKVYEDFQIACWRGGSAAFSINGNAQKVFPLAQYYIQNIETILHLQAGALEYVWTSVSASKKAQRPSAPILLVGTNSGLFQIASGTLTKWYNVQTDRQMYELDGNATIGSVSMYVYINISSEDYVLPLTNNMDITIKSGTMSCNNDIALLPGASITINQGAKASLGSNCRFYIYDKAEWPANGATAFNYNQVSFKAVNYVATLGKAPTYRTYANMADAKLDVNGILEISKAIYTTAGGADICSSEGTGKIVLKAAAGSETTTYQATQSGTSISYTSIPITAAQLHNGDGSYVATAGAVANDQFIYSKSQEKWLKNPKVVSWNANGGTTEASTLAYSQGSFVGELPAAYYDGYTLEGWYTAASGGSAIEPTTKVTANATYYAHWTPKSYTITYRDMDGVAFSGTHVDSPTAHPTTHTFGTATTLNDATKEHYTFGGWYRTPSCSGAVVTTIAATECKNITLYAKWTINKYIVSVSSSEAEWGTVSAASVTEVPYGSAVTVNGNTLTVNGATITATPADATAQYTYAFDHWNNLPATVTGNVSIEAVFTRTVNQYTVLWKSEDGTSTIETDDNQNYGAATAFNGTTPTKDATGQYTYTFDGWAVEANGAKVYNNGETPAVSADATYYAHFSAATNTYTVTWKNVNNVILETDENVPYGTMPTYDGETPAHPDYVDNIRWDRPFEGWTPAIGNVTGNVEYTAAYGSEKAKTYTIIWQDYDGTELARTTANYGWNWPEYPGVTPQRSDAKVNYTFIGWTEPATSLVAGNAIFTAVYRGDIEVAENEQKIITENTVVTTATIRALGRIEVANAAKLTTENLIIEATPNKSGEVVVSGDMEVTGEAYFDFEVNSDDWHWNAFGVPFEIDLTEHAPLLERTTPMTLGYDYDIVYYNAQTRATQGAGDRCWDYVQHHGRKLIPGKMYLIVFNHHLPHVDVIRFTKASGKPVDYTEEVPLTVTGTGINDNWNGISNPKMYHALLDAGVTECQVHDGGAIGEDAYIMHNMNNKKFFVGKAAFVQSPASQSVVIATPATTQLPIVAQAPRRAAAETAIDHYDVQIASEYTDLDDRIYVLTAEEKEDQYVIVADLAKAGVSKARAQMWVNRYGTKLCKNTTELVDYQANYPLGIFAPAEGNYDLFIDEQPNDGSMLYLTLDGEAIWNLSYGGYTVWLEEGTTNRYGLRVVAKAPQITTPIEEVTIENGETIRKIISGDMIYIIRNGETYTITGQKK